AEVLGRGTIPETDVYSTACAVQNLWLAARAEGLGVGWVSFYRPPDLRALLGIPDRADPIAWLCLGWPDERPVRPGLEAAGWAARMPLDAVVMEERWAQDDAPAAPPRPLGPTAGASPVAVPDPAAAPVDPPPTAAPDRAAAIAARDRLDQLVKPAGSLGALEPLLECWAAITGAPPPARLRAGVLVCAADHGHARRGTSLFDPVVSAQVAAAAARGETAVGVLARRDGHALLVADVGLAGPTPPGVRDAKVAPGSADLLDGPALTDAQLDAALAAGARLCGELAEQGVDCLVLGEIGIGNTATTAALASALTGASPERTVGRGTGVDAAGLERKRAFVTDALARHGFTAQPPTATPPPAANRPIGRAAQPAPATDRPIGCAAQPAPATDRPTGYAAHPPPAARQPTGRAILQAVGGLELVALAGAAAEAARRRLPVVLDGYATAVAALAATRDEPLVGEALIASHRSAEPGHDVVLAELGLEPLLDLRLRLGEASGALLALPVIAAAGALHREMGTFEESGVARSVSPTREGSAGARD
ncbi:MAG TPA: nicotinate-nucleotide--dimethylbenzimidazole phosphoribosyltransferase, partial [Conexibacter sp.]|nr:nicotinate-nucleotide--dimethylbenzimidazole phosphoribosyltransferase [Conexibacter sp.]